ncbi:hypothetical protein [Rhizobium halophytocola]|uniref:Uncharacterized protein n=1 Tax=Rhizobium halophytocola TaxID=735519 RepID=A0ABS4E6D7_9HYPH|nr:hypothetical protein [Rhizobium halophytocola]MBP1853512.1 hypothetical protein [Rhizobium halophytocola]
MTDWNVIRGMMAAAIDACERVEATGVQEGDREAVVRLLGQDVSVFDLLTSAWTYPENIRYAIIRERHDRGDNLAHVPEFARILVAMAQAAAETIGSSEGHAPAGAQIDAMIAWYGDHAVPGIEKAIDLRRSRSS